MSEEVANVEEVEPDRVKLVFAIQPSWDHQAHKVVVWAPDEWNDMSREEQEKFLEDQATEWVNRGEVIEWSGSVYDPDEPSDGWDNTSYEDEYVEDWF